MVNNGIKIDTKGLKDLEKIKIPEISIEGIEAKSIQKEMKQLEKDIAKGAKTIDGEYTNTLNGLRAKLRDLKAELGTLDIDVDADAFADLTDEIKDLNDQVKQMEQDYGTFSRNVGNYTESVVDALNEFDGQMYETAGSIEEVKNGVDSLKGKQLFDVKIGDTVVQFENISQAIGEIDDMAHSAAARMMELKNAGEENTEEYARLNQEFQEFVTTSAELEKARKYADELRDSMASTTRGLDMGVQAFEAMGNAMQLASGIAGLFGQDQEKIAEAINRTVQIQAILQSAQELYQQTIQKGTVLNKAWTASLAGAEKVMKMFGISTKATSTAMVATTRATKAASVAMKGLKVAIASTGIGLLVVALGEVIPRLIEFSKKFFDSGENARTAANEIKRYKDELQGINDIKLEVEDFKLSLGLQDEVETAQNKFNIVADSYKKMVDEIEGQSKKLPAVIARALKIDTDNLDIEYVLYLIKDLSDEYQRAEEYVDKYAESTDEAEAALYREGTATIALVDYLRELVKQYDGVAKAKANSEKTSSGKTSSTKTSSGTSNYEQQEKDAKEYAKKLLEINDKLEDDKLAILKDGFEKKMLELDKQEIREIRKARESGVKVNEQILSIQKKYAIERERLTEQENERIEQLNKGFIKSFTEASTDSWLNTLEADKLKMERNLGILTESFQSAFLNLRRNLENIYKETEIPWGETKEYSFSVDMGSNSVDSSALKAQQDQLNELRKTMDATRKEYEDAIFYAEWYAETVGINLERVVEAHQKNQLSDEELGLLYGYTENAKKELSATEKEILEYNKKIDEAKKKMLEADKNYMAALTEFNKKASLQAIKDAANVTSELKMTITRYFTEIMPTDEKAEGWLDNSVIIYNLTKNLDKIPEEYDRAFKELNKITENYYSNLKLIEKETVVKYADDVVKTMGDNLDILLQEFGKSYNDDNKTMLSNLVFDYNNIIGDLYNGDLDVRDFTNKLEEAKENIFDFFISVANSSEENVKTFKKFEESIFGVVNASNVKIESQARLHNEKMKQIHVDGENAKLELTRQYNIKTYEEYSRQFDKVLELYDNFGQEIYTSNYALDVFGQTYLKLGQNLKFNKVFEVLGEEISGSRQKLDDEIATLKYAIDTSKKLGNDTSADEIKLFNLEQSRDDLEKLEKEIDSFTQSTSMNLLKWSQTISELFVAAFDSIGQIVSGFAEAAYNNEMNRIEELEKLYDEENEALREKLEEQEELYEKHNQNVQDIEGELQTARGDRRLFLLDQINSEMLKREQAWAAQQKIAKQQEQLEKKQEQLEKQREAAEKKRNKVQQKVQIAQALASTALAVTNALAVQPWFLGLALSAVAAAMGAAQVAVIRSQKYADGGVIQGASHANGGVKVLGGSAEVEGGEYITNKVTTSKNVDVLTFINSKKKKLDLSDFVEFYSTSKSYTKTPKTIFADGGQLPDMQAPMINVRDVVNANNQDNRPIYVSVTEIENVQNRVRNVRAVAGLE